MNATIPRYPTRLDERAFYTVAYPAIYKVRKLEEAVSELFRKGYIKGTVTLSIGNEATAVAAGIPFRPRVDVLAILHRDLAVHLLHGLPIHTLLCQYMANAQSPTHAHEGNVHHGNAAQRRFPMISHLGNMLSTAVGGVWAARQGGEDALGLTVIGDGGTSTGDFHESLNIASVRNVPVLFLIQNNLYAYSTPVQHQFSCQKLSDRAVGYGIEGKTVDGTNGWEVYSAICDAMDIMQRTQKPYLLECMTVRLKGHAVYDQAEYVSEAELAQWLKRDPLHLAYARAQELDCFKPTELEQLQQQIDEELKEAIQKALQVSRPTPPATQFPVYAPATTTQVQPYSATNLRNFTAVTHALNYLLEREPRAVVLGQDVGRYGSAFKTCKGLFETFGPNRVMDMPIAESATVGFALGASQTGARPIMEFQFADFATEAATQLGLNCGTWYFRSDNAAPLVFRLPCGGGITLGAFHSAEVEGLWARFPGLKLLYPTTPQETFEAIVAAFYDPNPCLVLEHKFLYTRTKGDINFDGNLSAIWQPRRYREGSEVTVIALGAMVEMVCEALDTTSISADVWNPFVITPLDMGPIFDSVRKTGRLLVVQESGETAGLGDRFVSLVMQQCFGALTCAPRLVSAPDIPVPFAPELEIHYRPQVKTIVSNLNTLIGDA